VSAPGAPAHLVRRFFGSLRARRPGPADQAWIAGLLAGPEASLFWAQPPVDQRHGLEVARRAAGADAPRVVVAAALLHDVGKRHSATGTPARSLASVAALLHLPVRGRWQAYLDHGRLGALDLDAAGADPLIVAFARHHHLERPPAVPQEAWDTLSLADDE
jgi:hypothetical protein